MCRWCRDANEVRVTIWCPCCFFSGSSSRLFTYEDVLRKVIEKEQSVILVVLGFPASRTTSRPATTVLDDAPFWCDSWGKALPAKVAAPNLNQCCMWLVIVYKYLDVCSQISFFLVRRSPTPYNPPIIQNSRLQDVLQTQVGCFVRNIYASDPYFLKPFRTCRTFGFRSHNRGAY